MKGFDAEFRDLDHYIRAITARIWEGGRVDDIHRYYSADCAVETPSSVSIGAAAVVAGTRSTLDEFPDRRLLAEDVVISGDEDGGFLSSHRIFSPMTHAGAGRFAAGPLGRTVYARTIADCVCIDNRIVHEWLVRDQGAIALQLGLDERSLAQRWLNQSAGQTQPAMPPAPAPYRSFIDPGSLAQGYAGAFGQLWGAGFGAAQAMYDKRVISALPGGQTACGRAVLDEFWHSLRAALQAAEFSVEHLVANARNARSARNPRNSRATAIAMRWRVRASHDGAGRYGPPTGKPVQIMGISHAEVDHNGRVVREWVLIDEIALWMQLLNPNEGVE